MDAVVYTNTGNWKVTARRSQDLFQATTSNLKLQTQCVLRPTQFLTLNGTENE